MALALAHAMLNPTIGSRGSAFCAPPGAAWLSMICHRPDQRRRSRSAGPPRTELLVERLHLLSDHGRLAALRVLDVLTSVPALRASPTGSPRTGLRPWGGETGSPRTMSSSVGCISHRLARHRSPNKPGSASAAPIAWNPIARANVGLLWSCLDRLPAGEQDLLGPALDAALDKLTALPDPAANTDFGVQLMTIHRSKGLEF